MSEEKEPIYGFPCVEDPHDFHPDGECCSEKQIEAHKLACETWGTPEYQPNVGCADFIDPVTGQRAGHVTRTSWGIGTNMVPKSWMTPEPCETHEWVTERMGGDPAEASSNERVTYCKACGVEPDDEVLTLPLGPEGSR